MSFRMRDRAARIEDRAQRKLRKTAFARLCGGPDPQTVFEHPFAHRTVGIVVKRIHGYVAEARFL